jgi:hypothetical protein
VGLGLGLVFVLGLEIALGLVFVLGYSVGVRVRN